jgi:hypothetical protein
LEFRKAAPIPKAYSRQLKPLKLIWEAPNSGRFYVPTHNRAPELIYIVPTVPQSPNQRSMQRKLIPQNVKPHINPFHWLIRTSCV